MVLAALYWKRLTAAGVFAALATTVLTWSYLFWKSDFGDIPNYSVDITLGGVTYQTMPVATILICSAAAMVLVSLITRAPDKSTLAKFFDE